MWRVVLGSVVRRAAVDGKLGAAPLASVLSLAPSHRCGACGAPLVRSRSQLRRGRSIGLQGHESRCASGGNSSAQKSRVVTVFDLTRSHADALSEHLLQQGVSTVVESSPVGAEQSWQRMPASLVSTERPDGRVELTDANWKKSRLVAFFPDDANGDQLEDWVADQLRSVARDVGTDLTAGGSCAWAFRCEAFEDTEHADWERRALSSLEPVSVAGFDIAFEQSPSSLRGSNQQILINPSMAFGTGEHETTRLCLEAIQRLLSERGFESGLHVVDYGAGSGVLGIAALLLGAQSCLCVDVDEACVTSAQRNALLNGVDDRMRCILVDHVEAVSSGCVAGVEEGAFPPADVLVANILLEPLIELEGTFSRLLKSGGRLVLSGILADQVPEVERRYGVRFCSLETRTAGEWAAISAVKK